MRKLLCLLMLSGTVAAEAQTVATFDTLSLPKQDTFYVNYSDYGKDVGFNDGLAHFPCVYDTFPGGFQSWMYGFAYSNMTDVTTAGYANQYSAITGKGYNNSPQYLIGFSSNHNNRIYLKGKAVGKPVNGFYITNTTYAYLSMKDGDAFAKKFGGASGNDPDFFKATIYGFRNGNLTPDSIETYLADFTSGDNTKDTILNGWQWVNLLPLGNVDSLEIRLSSSDNGTFGMNTPAYYAIDNFSTFETSAVKDVQVTAAKIYPNPAASTLFAEVYDAHVKSLYITDMSGRVLITAAISGRQTVIPVAALPSGIYLLHLTGDNGTAATRFVKQ